MKQLITIIGAAALIAGSTVTSIKSANLGTQNNISIKHIIPRVSAKVSPAQNIINKINPKTLVFVPNGTDPNISSPKTQTIIKSQLQKYNPKLEASDLSTLSFSGLKQLANNPQPLVVTATVDQTSAHVTIQIRLASQLQKYYDANFIVYVDFNTADIKQILALELTPHPGRSGTAMFLNWIFGHVSPAWPLGAQFRQWFLINGYDVEYFNEALGQINWATLAESVLKPALFDGNGVLMHYYSILAYPITKKVDFVFQ